MKIMPKIKTRKGASKRFRITKNGKVMRRRQNARHLQTNKTKSHQRRMKRTGFLKGNFKKKITEMI